MWQAGYPVIEKAGYPVPYNMQYGLIGICQKLYFSGPTGKRKCFPEVPVVNRYFFKEQNKSLSKV